MKNVLNFPNYNTFFLSTKKKVFNGMSRIIAYSKSHFMLKICILVEWLIIEIIIQKIQTCGNKNYFFSFVDVSRFTVNHQMKNLTKLLLMSYADCSLLLLSLTFSYKLLIIPCIQIFHYDLLHINDFL